MALPGADQAAAFPREFSRWLEEAGIQTDGLLRVDQAGMLEDANPVSTHINTTPILLLRDPNHPPKPDNTDLRLTPPHHTPIINHHPPPPGMILPGITGPFHISNTPQTTPLSLPLPLPTAGVTAKVIGQGGGGGKLNALPRFSTPIVAYAKPLQVTGGGCGGGCSGQADVDVSTGRFGYDLDSIMGMDVGGGGGVGNGLNNTGSDLTALSGSLFGRSEVWTLGGDALDTPPHMYGGAIQNMESSIILPATVPSASSGLMLNPVRDQSRWNGGRMTTVDVLPQSIPVAGVDQDMAVQSVIPEVHGSNDGVGVGVGRMRSSGVTTLAGGTSKVVVGGGDQDGGGAGRMKELSRLVSEVAVDHLNLRWVPRFGKSSPYIGVTKHRKSNRWEAHIWIKEYGRQLYLGGFSTAEEAACAYDLVAIKCKGLKAVTNFRTDRYASMMSWLSKISLPEMLSHVRRRSKGFSRGNSMYRGVTQHPNGRWESRIGISGNRHIYLGLYEKQESAAGHYDRALVRMRGWRATTNFPLSEYNKELKEFEELGKKIRDIEIEFESDAILRKAYGNWVKNGGSEALQGLCQKAAKKKAGQGTKTATLQETTPKNGKSPN